MAPVNAADLARLIQEVVNQMNPMGVAQQVAEDAARTKSGSPPCQSPQTHPSSVHLHVSEVWVVKIVIEAGPSRVEHVGVSETGGSRG